MTQPNDRLDKIVLEARRNAEQRAQGYREQALKLFPWVCGRCARGFERSQTEITRYTMPIPHRTGSNPQSTANNRARMLNRPAAASAISSYVKFVAKNYQGMTLKQITQWDFFSCKPVGDSAGLVRVVVTIPLQPPGAV